MEKKHPNSLAKKNLLCICTKTKNNWTSATAFVIWQTTTGRSRLRKFEYKYPKKRKAAISGGCAKSEEQSKFQNSWGKVEQRLECTGSKLPSKEITNRSHLGIILTVGAVVPYRSHEMNSDIRFSVESGVWTAHGPVNPSEGPIRIMWRVEHVKESRNVMFIRVASRPTIFAEEGVIVGVGDYGNSEWTVKFKPLRAFTPMTEVYVGEHIATVATSSIPGGIIVWLNKAMVRISQIFVYSWEVVDRDAALWKKNKSFVWKV